MRSDLVVAVGLILGLITACGDAGGKKPEPAKTAAVEGAMCEEHGVLEAICTKCNPNLIPVFKAKGDWCEEHGFPESVCPICNPAAGGRPAQDVAKDDAPPDGTKVRLKSQDTARLAGIKTVKAENRPGGARLEVLASIAYDATRWAEVNARASGVVRSMKVDVGATVKAGAALAIIESASVGADRSRLRASASRVAAALASFDREKDLQLKGYSATKDVLAAEQELAAARAEQESAAAAVKVIGQGAGASGYVVTSPIAGVVTKRGATMGHMVEPDETLFEVVDTSSMRVELDIPELELARVRTGQNVIVVLDAAPETEFTGTIDYIAPEIDRETRTAKARATLSNPDGMLRANMFGHARIALGDAQGTALVPRMAVQRVKEVELVFVKTAEGEYEARRVTTGVMEGDRAEIIKGIKPGDEVVTEGSFLLKTETLKGSIGAGCCE